MDRHRPGQVRACTDWVYYRAVAFAYTDAVKVVDIFGNDTTSLPPITIG